jgi:hypothetical protein
MGMYEGWSRAHNEGVPDRTPIKYKWGSVKERITEEEFHELNALVDSAPEWAGAQDDPRYLRWQELDKKVHLY